MELVYQLGGGNAMKEHAVALKTDGTALGMGSIMLMEH